MAKPTLVNGQVTGVATQVGGGEEPESSSRAAEDKKGSAPESTAKTQTNIESNE